MLEALLDEFENLIWWWWHLRNQSDLQISNVGAGRTSANEIVERMKEVITVVVVEKRCRIEMLRGGAVQRCGIDESAGGVCRAVDPVGPDAGCDDARRGYCSPIARRGRCSAIAQRRLCQVL